MDKRVYVLRSIDDKITKIGQSYHPNNRAYSIKINKGKEYVILYQSNLMSKEDALQVEKEAKEHFKDYLVEGTEWFDIKPLKVIRYFINLLGTTDRKQDLKKLLNLSKYESWFDSNVKYEVNGEIYKDTIKILKDHTAYIQLIYNNRRKTIGFANIGDAIKFNHHYKYYILAKDYITNMLYNLDYEEWKLINNSEEYLEEHPTKNRWDYL